MSYEYNPHSVNLDFPNPFVVENYFLFFAAALQCMGALAMLLICRRQVQLQDGTGAVFPILVGVGLLVSGINHARRAMMQLRFFFGRSKPVSLAPDRGPGAEGTTPAAEFLKKTVRQHAIDYPVPRGPLNGVLYSWIPNLIFSPGPIQRLAQRQFHNVLAILVTLLSFLISWVGFSSISSAAWLGLFYFGFSLFLLIRPLESTRFSGADVGIRALVILVLCAVFGPVLVPLLAPGLPNIAWLSLDWQTLFLLLASLVSVGLFFRALLCQMNTPPQTNPALEQISLSMNCHPNQLMDELDRKLQQEWSEQIPNRRYCKISPNVSGEAGSFQADLLEETQPMPSGSAMKMDLTSALSVPRFFRVASIDLLGLTLIAISVLSLLAFASKTQIEFGPASMTAYFTLGLAGLTLGGFCLRVGHPLWGRFDFKSQLIWVTMEGNYQAAKLAYGNQFTDRIKTQKRVINIETMTLRVWVAELETVIFDTNSPRYLIALHGLRKRASDISSHLARFAGEQSMVVSPTATSDLQKAALLGNLNRAGDGVDTTLQQSLMDAVVAAQTGRKPSPVPAKADIVCCGNCRASAPEGDRFCSMCGAALSLPAATGA